MSHIPTSLTNSLQPAPALAYMACVMV